MKRRRRRADSHGRQCCINLSSPSTYSGRPLMLDFLLLVMVFVTATIVTVHGGLDETSSGGEQEHQQHKSGLNDDHDERIAHELKLFNQQHSRSRSSGTGSKIVFTGAYSSSSPSSSSSFTNGNVSVYSIRRNQQSSSAAGRKTTNSNRRGANSNHSAAQNGGGNKRKKLEATSLRPKSSVVRLSEIDRDTSGYFDNNNRSEARGEWSGKSINIFLSIDKKKNT